MEMMPSFVIILIIATALLMVRVGIVTSRLLHPAMHVAAAAFNLKKLVQADQSALLNCRFSGGILVWLVSEEVLVILEGYYFGGRPIPGLQNVKTAWPF